MMLKVVSSTFMCIANNDKTKQNKKMSTVKGSESLLDGFAFSLLPSMSHLDSPGLSSFTTAGHQST